MPYANYFASCSFIKLKAGENNVEVGDMLRTYFAKSLFLLLNIYFVHK